MQIHGCGLFNIRELFGSESHMASAPIQLIVDIDPTIKYEKDPLEVTRKFVTLLGIKIPKLTIPLPKQRNLPLLIELLARKEIAEK